VATLSARAILLATSQEYALAEWHFALDDIANRVRCRTLQQLLRWYWSRDAFVSWHG
jgi:hypothetical protein